MKGYVYGPAMGVFDISPFCSKLITYAKLAKIDVAFVPGSPMKAPKRKLPYIEWDGRLIADSSAIIDAWSAAGWDLDAHLSASQRHESRAIQSMIEEHLYFHLLHLRWVDGWSVYGDVIKQVIRNSGAPRAIVGIAVKKARADVIKSLHAQGVGRHDDAFLLAQATDLLASVAYYLEREPGVFVFGEQPSAIDAVCFAFLDAIITPDVNAPLITAAREMTAITSYVEHVRAYLS